MKRLCPAGEALPIAADQARRGHSTPVSERFIRCIWYSLRRYLKPTIRTLDGRPIRILSPGRWNTGPGPDFLDGVFSLDCHGARCADVEIHRRRSDWRAHRHEVNPAYRRVGLHVFLQESAGHPLREMSSKGNGFTEICLATQIQRPISALRGRLKTDRFPYGTDAARGRCNRILNDLPPARKKELLLAAAEARLAERALRMARVAQKKGFDQALYEMLLESLGYRSHKAPFLSLARRVPWASLREIARAHRARGRVLAVEALLMGCAGLIPRAPAPEWDCATRRHWHRCNSLWKKLQRRHHFVPLRASSWKGWGSRPANAPWRRIAGVSHILAGAALTGPDSLLRGLSRCGDRKTLSRCIRALTVPPSGSYWLRRFSWGGTSLQRGVALLGRERAIAIVGNVLLPFLVVQGKAACARALYRRLPAVESNAVTRLATARFFGGRARFAAFIQQQGLLHIYRRFCESDRSGCRECGLPRLLTIIPPA
ncbi:MAG: DUF2851 family protein [Candidatus Aureabacteria bacterium]|nr:DUF2851 family protein [Candidatus Auribacterota bacterium]